MASFPLITPSTVIITPISQSSLLSISKPSLFSLRRPICLFPCITAVADNKSGDNIEIGGGRCGTLISQSSLLSISKPSLFSLRRPIRLFPFITAVADNKSGDNIEIGGGGGSGSGGCSFGGGGSSGEEENDKEKEKKSGMSMSQKLTLGYAVLVGVGGVMGYMKSGSKKSLAAGGVSSLLLYYVYTQLPTNPAFASSLGLGVSAALLAVMGSRFKKSGKLFPAGVVSLVSLVMVGGYFHGILRGMHG